MTEDTLGPELRLLLELTAQQHKIKRRIDLVRARVDENARTAFESTGVAPTWKLPKLGQIRLDGIDPQPVAEVRDEDAFASWLAQRHPSEVEATITVPADQLEAALQVLEFGEVTVARSKVAVRPTGKTAVLAKVDLVENEAGTWDAIDPESGELLPGVGGRIASAPRLVVAVDPKTKTAVTEEADAEDAATRPKPDLAVVDTTNPTEAEEAAS